MTRSSRHEALRAIERSRLQQSAAEFAAAWRTRGPRDSEIFLPKYLPIPGDPLRVVVLLELIPIDMENRWERGDGILLEQYLEDYPELTRRTIISAFFGQKEEGLW